jgi:hypothetical protein
MLASPIPQHEVFFEPPQEKLSATQRLLQPPVNPISKKGHYHYVPVFGLRGFFLWEGETKGRQPFDDILRLLADTYIEHHSKARKS